MADVRRATAADLDQLVEMARALHAESPEYRDEPFDSLVTRRWIQSRLGGGLLVDEAAVFVTEVGGHIAGALVAMIVPRWFNTRRIACEMTLYVRPEHRGGRCLLRLVEAYKAWARQQGAVEAKLGVSTGIHPERTVRAYARLGFRLDGYNTSTKL